MNLDGIMLSEISQTEKTKYSLLSLICESKINITEIVGMILIYTVKLGNHYPRQLTECSKCGYYN